MESLKSVTCLYQLLLMFVPAKPCKVLDVTLSLKFSLEAQTIVYFTIDQSCSDVIPSARSVTNLLELFCRNKVYVVQGLAFAYERLSWL